MAVKNHANGAKNPLAHMRKVITMEQALTGKPVSEPLTVYDCSLISDGAAAVVIAPLERAVEFTEKAGPGAAASRRHPTFVALDRKRRHHHISRRPVRGRQGLQDGRRQLPPTSSSPKCTTASRSPRSSPSKTWDSCQKGQGGRYSLAGRTVFNGERPVNTSGGLKSKGHPVGATGVGQICDVVQQIRGEAGERQVRESLARPGAESGRLGRHLRRFSSGGSMNVRGHGHRLYRDRRVLAA